MSSRHVADWLAKAENDLASGKLLLHAAEPITDTAAFHAQQAVEKYLKAFLIFNDKEIPKTHSISDLIQACKELNPEFSVLDRPEINRLSRYAVSGRYPGEFHTPSIDEAGTATNLATEVKTFVLAKLGAAGYQATI